MGGSSGKYIGSLLSRGDANVHVHGFGAASESDAADRARVQIVPSDREAEEGDIRGP
jgi:hypothetical protein